ncbi:MAG: ferredoxin-type protein NapG [Methylococcales bacterium]|jgi:ferredoxin-type protein NapG|nr:ferredoxin-type protein NapG [Methylococcales bacterium]MBT7409172.1 ferredoxin-type protein NapG [Methylococcales bacterium]
MNNSGSTKNRRQFLVDSAQTLCGVSLFGLGLSIYSDKSSALPPQALRPPGALTEKQFLSACVRCGLCVRDCPYDILKLGQLNDPVAMGTPYFEARKIPCEMCEDIPCVKACPTGALDHELTDINLAKMGLAVLIDHESCLNYLGLRCDVCYRVCPAIDEAITLQAQRNKRTGKHTRFIPVVHSKFCTGCGKCEQACVLEEAAIKVLPSKLAQGKSSEHYRLGWEEKAKAGRSLIPKALELPSYKPVFKVPGVKQ